MVNLDNISYIEDSHGKKAVILSLESYESMIDQLEDLNDLRSYMEAKEDPRDHLPFDIVEKLLNDDESKVKIMRKYRKYTVTELAKKIGVTEAYLSQIENNRRKGTVDLYKKLSAALDIEIDILVA